MFSANVSLISMRIIIRRQRQTLLVASVTSCYFGIFLPQNDRDTNVNWCHGVVKERVCDKFPYKIIIVINTCLNDINGLIS